MSNFIILNMYQIENVQLTYNALTVLVFRFYCLEAKHNATEKSRKYSVQDYTSLSATENPFSLMAF